MSKGKDPHESERLTDLANAERFVREHGEDIRYCPAWGKWLVWDGTRWSIDDTGAVEGRAKDTVRGMYKQASQIEDSGEREKFGRHATRSEYGSRIREMMSLAQTENGIPVKPEQLDSGHFLLNCRNGTLDLQTGKLRTHNHKDLMTKLAPVDYDTNARCPTFDQFIVRITGGDQEWPVISSAASDTRSPGMSAKRLCSFSTAPATMARPRF